MVRVRKTLVAACMVLAMYSIAVPHLIQARGEKLITLISGSMEPTYMTGGTIRIKPVADLETPVTIGDAITFAGDNGTLVTHRIIEFVHLPNSKTLYYRTKGDHNPKPDPFITPSNNVIGKVEGRLAEWQALAFWLQKPIPRAVMFAIPMLSLLFTELFAMVGLIRTASRGKALATARA